MNRLNNPLVLRTSTTRVFSLLVPLFLIGFIWQARAEGVPIIAVFDIKGQEFPTKFLRNLTDYFVGKLAEGGVFQLVPRDEMRDRLSKQKKESYQLCYDQRCQIEIGREFAAQKMLAPEISRIGRKCVLVASLFDLQRVVTETSATEKSTCTQDGLLAAVEKVAERLRVGEVSSQMGAKGSAPRVEVSSQMGAKGSAPRVEVSQMGALEVKSNPPDAEIRIDGVMIKGRTPFTLDSVEVGIHLIELFKDNQTVSTDWVRVRPGETETIILEMKLTEEGKQIVERQKVKENWKKWQEFKLPILQEQAEKQGPMPAISYKAPSVRPSCCSDSLKPLWVWGTVMAFTAIPTSFLYWKGYSESNENKEMQYAAHICAVTTTIFTAVTVWYFVKWLKE